MTDETGPSDPTDDSAFGDVPSEWSPPASSLPPIPPPSDPASVPPEPRVSSLAPPVADPTATVITGPVLADEPRRPRMIGRGVAVVAAAVLIGGGGYLALNAGSAEGGADSPEAALDGALEALSNEDLIGAAEFVEPSERETMIDAGFEMVQELVRLDVFDDSLDLSSVDGFDFEFDDVEISVVEVRPGLAHLFIESGTATTSVDGAAIPLGALITDRVDSEDLAITESSTEEMSRSEFPIVAVERDGRWYLSLWYSIAENALIATDASRPNAADRLTEIGADTPERAVANFVGALEQLDIATMIGMLDPEEASALYDYAPVFVDGAQEGVDELLRAVRDEGWRWNVADLQLRAETDGSLATVFVDRFEFEASGPEGAFSASFDSERIEVVFESEEISFEYVVEGDCFTMTFDEGYGPDTTEMCGDEILEEFGLGSLASDGLDGFTGTSTEDFGIVVREVAGRWYISPIRTGSQAMLQTIRGVDTELLGQMVDEVMEIARDPFAFESALGGDIVFGDDFGEDFEVPVPPDGEFTPSTYTEENAWLLADGLETAFVYDLVGEFRDDLWWLWLDEVDPRGFGDGVAAQAWLPDDRYIDLVVVDGMAFETDQALAEWLHGEIVTEGDFTYVRATNGWGDDLIVARSANGIAVINMFDGFSDSAVAALRNQVGR